MSTEKRTRAWTFVCYPDSLPPNWRDYLESLCIEVVVSPLHDKDINPTGEPKKPHYHVLFYFNGVKTETQIRNMIEYLNCPRPQICHDIRALVRYFVHADNPEKAQYQVKDIVTYGSLCIWDYFNPSKSEQQDILKGIFQIIESEKILEFSTLIQYIMKNCDDSFFFVATKCSTLPIQAYLKSKLFLYKSAKKAE